KRKRLAPGNLATYPLGSVRATLPTEADVISGDSTTSPEDPFPWDSSNRTAYLGLGSLSLAAIRATEGVLSTQLMSHKEDGNFATLAPTSLPKGRRLVVARAMKQVLIKNSRLEAGVSNGFANLEPSTPSSLEDEILELDDLPDYFDEETQREV